MTCGMAHGMISNILYRFFSTSFRLRRMARKSPRTTWNVTCTAVHARVRRSSGKNMVCFSTGSVKMLARFFQPNARPNSGFLNRRRLMLLKARRTS